ncbi:Lrp/AsnC ligand binding domain-containing protein [Lentzea roselyniae]|uniref:Lrp/AsnC ligand binding domain-containing protein n=1 Tax=Lentzea roselyniae TaxID=531940 RepID=UPI0031F976B7
MATIPEIQELHIIAGPATLLAKVRTATTEGLQDVPHLHRRGRHRHEHHRRPGCRVRTPAGHRRPRSGRRTLGSGRPTGRQRRKPPRGAFVRSTLRGFCT